jgi:hypothetical protein
MGRLALSLALVLALVLVPAPAVGVRATPIECTDATTNPNWPTFHVINAVSRDPKTGAYVAEHLNDANAVFEHAGIYHVMNQGSTGPSPVPVDSANQTVVVNITHAVSNDLVHWYRVQDAVPRTIQGACDGTVSFPGGSAFGTSPVLLFGPDCADPDGFPHEGELGSADYPRVATAFPADPNDPHLIHWRKALRNVSFVNGTTPSEPCSFPGKVWRSTVGPYWNMLCSPHWTGNWGGAWARYTSTDPALQSWTLADPNFITHAPIHPGGNDPIAHIDAASGAMFNPIPGAEPGGPSHMINAVTGQGFWLGTYHENNETFQITSDEIHWIDIGGGGGAFSGGAAHWAATSNSFATRPPTADNRLLWVAWVSAGGGPPNVNALSLVRTIQWDPIARCLVSFPVPEYTSLRNGTFIEGQSLGVLAPGSVKTLPIPTGAGGALDVMVQFDLSQLGKGETATRFGVATKAPPAGVEGAAQDVWFTVGAADVSGVRNVTVAGIMNGQPLSKNPNLAKPNPCYRNVCPSNVTTLHPGEPLSVRIVVDRPIVEVYVLGGRIAWVHSDFFFNASTSAVHVYNHGNSGTIVASNVSAFSMSCGWRSDLPPPKVFE